MTRATPQPRDVPWRRLRLPTVGLLLLPVLSAGHTMEHGQRSIVLEEAKAAVAYKERHYAPSRDVDVLHLKIEVTPDFDRRTVAGQTTLHFKPIGKPLQELQLDAVDLAVSAVHATQPVRGHRVTTSKLIVDFAKPLAVDQEVRLTVAHSAEPKRGFYFRTPQMGYKAGEAHLFTQGQVVGARHWFPSFDSPNEKFTSELIVHVPQGMTALSNGRLLFQRPGPRASLTTFHWRQEQPHVNYLISLVAGPFATLTDRHNNVPLAFHVLPSQLEYAQSSFRDTRDALGFFEREIGVPYPWAKYDQVCVNDFVAAGMENTSISTLSDLTLFSAATENIRSSVTLMAHELAHQWFGDLVTTKDWSHAWLNEGFATYYSYLYVGHKDGRDAMLYHLYRDAEAIVQKSDPRPIVYREFGQPFEQFDIRAYSKGSWVAHMLRSQLGEDLYRRSIRTYLQRHRFENVVTQELSAVLEQVSGRSFDQFFDQWVYHAQHPQLNVEYAWDAHSKLAKLTVEQASQSGSQALMFNLPLTVRFKFASGASVERQFTVSKQTEDFYFDVPQDPTIVRLDPHYTVLAQINFKLPNALLYAQLADGEDMIGQLSAMRQLIDQNNAQSEFVAHLEKLLQKSGFYGVRVKAAETLRKLHTRQALAALVSSLEQSDARVRQAVVDALSGFYREEAYAAVRDLLAHERNPAILASGMRAIGAYSQPEAREILLRFLQADSHRNELADGAIAAMRLQDDPAYIPPLRRVIAERAASFTSRGLGAALDALAYIGRNERDKNELRELIAGFTRSDKLFVRIAALTALGTLEDPKAIPILQPFADAQRDTPEQQSAVKALEALRAARAPAHELKALRDEVLELRKVSRELERKLDAQEKKPRRPGA